MRLLLEEIAGHIEKKGFNKFKVKILVTNITSYNSEKANAVLKKAKKSYEKFFDLNYALLFLDNGDIASVHEFTRLVKKYLGGFDGAMCNVFSEPRALQIIPYLPKMLCRGGWLQIDKPSDILEAANVMFNTDDFKNVGFFGSGFSFMEELPFIVALNYKDRHAEQPLGLRNKPIKKIVEIEHNVKLVSQAI